MTPLARPEYVTCVRRDDGEAKLTWCGKLHARMFVFESIDHAAFNGEKAGRLETCRECNLAIVIALMRGSA